VLGQVVTLQSAESRLPFAISLPSYLPPDTTLKEVRMHSDYNYPTVALIYSNPALPRIQEYQDGNFSILIIISRNPTSTPDTYKAHLNLESSQTVTTTVTTTYSNGTVVTRVVTITQIYTQSTGPKRVFNITSVNGIGWPRGDLDIGGGSVHVSRQLWCWRNDVEYQIIGDVDLSILAQIANSM
jgi:hypothetical protein